MNPTRTQTPRAATTVEDRRTARSHPSRPTRGEAAYGGYVDGANALQIGYADPVDDTRIDTESVPRRAGSRPVTGRPAVGRPATGRPAVGRPVIDRPATGRPAPSRATPTHPTPAHSAPAPARANPAVEPRSVAPSPVAVPRAPFLVLVLAVVIAGVLGVLVINTKINENAFRLDDLRAKQATLDLQEQQLTQQLNERESPGNLAAAAKRLGLVPAGTPAFINLPNGLIVGVPQPATGQSNSTAGLADPGR